MANIYKLFLHLLNINMTLYKNVEWKNPPTEEILSLIQAPYISDPKVGYIGRIPTDTQIKILKLLNVDEKLYDQHNMLLMYFPPKSTIMIHSDHRPKLPKEYQTNQTLILPLKNCEQIKWYWHEVTNPAGIFSYGEDNKFNPVPTVRKQDTKVLEEIYCDTPFIANIKQWHNLTNESDDIAIGITVRLLPWSCELDFSQPPVPDIVVN
jgi:hypothetical protein